MADRVFNGAFEFTSEAAGAESKVMSDFTRSVVFDPGRTIIDCPPTFGLDHGFDVTGSSFATFTATLQKLSPADKLIYIGFHNAQTFMEAIWRPLTGAVSATNLETRAQFPLVNHPTIVSVVDELDMWEVGTVRVKAYSITDGSTTFTYGTLLST